MELDEGEGIEKGKLRNAKCKIQDEQSIKDVNECWRSVMERRGEELENRLLDFAARVGKVVDAFPDTRLGRHVAGQLVRSGTSPAPNYAEACAAESKRDFIHELGIPLMDRVDFESRSVARTANGPVTG